MKTLIKNVTSLIESKEEELQSELLGNQETRKINDLQFEIHTLNLVLDLLQNINK